MAEQICEIGDIGVLTSTSTIKFSWLAQVSPVSTRLGDWPNWVLVRRCWTQTQTWVEPGTTIDTPVRDVTQRATPVFPFSRCEEKSES